MDKPTKPLRRKLLRRTPSAAIVGTAMMSTGQRILTAAGRHLRAMDTHVIRHEPVRIRAQQDSGIDLVFEPKDVVALLHISLNPAQGVRSLRTLSR
jgi:hypothetical protein